MGNAMVPALRHLPAARVPPERQVAGASAPLAPALSNFTTQREHTASRLTPCACWQRTQTLDGPTGDRLEERGTSSRWLSNATGHSLADPPLQTFPNKPAGLTVVRACQPLDLPHAFTCRACPRPPRIRDQGLRRTIAPGAMPLVTTRTGIREAAGTDCDVPDRRRRHTPSQPRRGSVASRPKEQVATGPPAVAAGILDHWSDCLLDHERPRKTMESGSHNSWPAHDCQSHACDTCGLTSLGRAHPTKGPGTRRGRNHLTGDAP